MQAYIKAMYIRVRTCVCVCLCVYYAYIEIALVIVLSVALTICLSIIAVGLFLIKRYENCMYPACTSSETANVCYKNNEVSQCAMQTQKLLHVFYFQRYT